MVVSIFFLSFSLGPLVIIVPLIVILMVVVFGLFSLGGVNFVFSPDKSEITLDNERKRAIKSGIYRLDLFNKPEETRPKAEPTVATEPKEPKPTGRPYIEIPIKRGTAFDYIAIEESEVKDAKRKGYKVIYR